jgi:hypothetical protein
MHPMPMITDAASEIMLRRDMVDLLLTMICQYIFFQSRAALIWSKPPVSQGGILEKKKGDRGGVDQIALNRLANLAAYRHTVD